MPRGQRELAGGVVQPTAVLLGAGFSSWAIGLPVAGRLFDFRIAVRNERERSRLGFVKRLYHDFLSRHPNGGAEQFIGEAIASSGRCASSVVWYVTRRLSDRFIASMMGGSQAMMIDDRRLSSIVGVRRVRAFLQTLRKLPLSGIMTPNYDLLVEYALGTGGFNYGVRGEILYGRGRNPGFPWQGAWPILTGDVILAKIHGSLSWDRNMRYTDGRAGVRGNALIVAPYSGKTPPATLKPVWRIAESVLKSASRLLVFGFAFNQYDVALLRLLGSAGKSLGSVHVIDLVPRDMEARALWPNAEVTWSLPPPAGKNSIAEWLDQYWVTMPPT